MLLPPLRDPGALQRVMVVALLAPVLLIAAIASVPVFAILPFLSHGTERTVRILTAHTAYARTLLTASCTPSDPTPPRSRHRNPCQRVLRAPDRGR
ncbi:dTMP kinase [Kitasatospora sp. NPDC001683]